MSLPPAHNLAFFPPSIIIDYSHFLSSVDQMRFRIRVTFYHVIHAVFYFRVLSYLLDSTFLSSDLQRLSVSLRISSKWFGFSWILPQLPNKVFVGRKTCGSWVRKKLGVIRNQRWGFSCTNLESLVRVRQFRQDRSETYVFLSDRVQRATWHKLAKTEWLLKSMHLIYS